MKKSIVVSTQPTKFSALAFKEDFEKSIKKVADSGFDGAELAVRNPKDLKVENIINIIKGNNLEVPAIGTGQAYGEESLSFSDPNEIIRKMVVNRVDTHGLARGYLLFI
ncbi:5-keto-L-gluconate epimerase [subsurface metagenome]